MVARFGRDYGLVAFLRTVETTDQLRQALDEIVAQGENVDLADTYVVCVYEVARDPVGIGGGADPEMLVNHSVSIRPIRERSPSWQDILGRGDPDWDDR